MNHTKPTPFWRERTGSGKITTFIFIALVVIAIGVVGGGLYWKFVVNRTLKAAELTPENSQLFLKLEWREDSTQNNNLNALSENLGGRTTVDAFLTRFLGTTYANSAVNFRNDIAPWLGDEVALSRANTASADQQITLFSVANATARDTFLAKIEKEATNVAPETYKTISVKTLTGKLPISYAIVSNFVVVAPKLQLVKDVIDVSKGSAKSISKNDDYKLIARNLTQQAIFSGFIDVAPIFRANSALLGGANVQISPNSHARLGVAVVADQTGFSLKAFMPKTGGNNTAKNDFHTDILGLLPDSVVGYFGGSDLSGFMRQYLTTLLGIPKIFKETLTTSTIEKKYGVNLENDLFSWMKGEYVASYLDEKQNDFGLIVKIDNSSDVAKKMLSVEKVIVGLFSENATDPQYKNVAFAEGKTGSTVVRYLPLPGTGGQYLNYAIKNNYLVVATSRTALDSILAPSDTQSSFLASTPYSFLTRSLPQGALGGTLFVNRDFFLKLLSAAGYNFSAYKQHILGMDFVSVENKDGTLISGSLPIL